MVLVVVSIAAYETAAIWGPFANTLSSWLRLHLIEPRGLAVAYAVQQSVSPDARVAMGRPTGAVPARS